MAIIKYLKRSQDANDQLPDGRYHPSYREDVKKSQRTRTWIRRIVLATGVFGMIFGTGFTLLSVFMYYNLPNVEVLQDIRLIEPLKIYTRDKKLMAEIGQIKRTPIEYEQIPEHVKNAFLAAEDSRFFEHFGIDLFSLARAAFQYTTGADLQTGASTITMQLARTFYLTRTRTLWRKYREILLALKIENELEKEQILTLYLNKIFLGYKSYGIVAAARNYYDSSMQELSLARAATLAGLPKAPSRFNPVVNPSRALERRDWILARMHTLGYISEHDYRQAITEDITPTPFWSTTEAEAHYAAEMARQQLVTGDLLARGGVNSEIIYNSGLRVYTTIDSAMQQAANNAVATGLFAYENRQGYRGAETHFSAFDTEPTSDFSDDFAISEQQIEEVRKQLAELSDYGGQIIPAVVLDVFPKTLRLLLADGSEHILDMSTDFPYKKLYSPEIDEKTDEDVETVSPTDFYDFLQSGDVVRLRRKNGRLLLSQLPQVQASLSSIDPIDGAIRALVGGFYYYHSKYNRAVQAKRQLGSTIKPLIYSYALENGFRAGSVIVDTPLRFKPDDNWRPQNADSRFAGAMTIRQALYKSRNVVSIRLLNQMSISEVIKFLQRFDLSKSYPQDLSLALGTANATTIGVSRAYSIFANGGALITPYLIERIETSDGRLLYQQLPQGNCYRDRVVVRTQDTTTDETEIFSLQHVMRYCNSENEIPRQILDPQVAYIMNDILKGIARSGTARRLKELKRADFGGKTGTTNDNIDAWFTGVHPLLVTSVWIGFDTPAPLGKGEGGSRAALPIWLDYTSNIASRIPIAMLSKPQGIESHFIDPKTGDLVDSDYPGAIKEIFRAENLPQQSSKLIIQNESNKKQVLERPEDIF